MLPGTVLNFQKSTAFVIALLLQGCSTVSDKAFVPVDPELLVEWSVEGAVEYQNKTAKNNARFYFENIDGETRLDIQPSSDKINKELSAIVSLEQLNYWLRALPVTSEAIIEVTKGNQVTSIKELDWEVTYDGYMQIEEYSLPDQITLSGPAGKVQMDVVRAETGMLSNPCPGNIANNEVSTPDAAVDNIVDTLVPQNGTAPLPRWIDKQGFCRQLLKVHGKVPDPKIGLYGPDSMMWRLSGPLAPGGMGAGRALLLQTAHPWITAGIDEHSIVRYDPIERARRTAVNVSTMVFGSMPQVLRSAHKVHKTHVEIQGKIPYRAGAFHQGSEYRANEVNAMIWVHATLWETLVMMYEQLEEPLSLEEKNRFYEETKLFAMLFGIPENALPKDWNEFMAYNQAMWNSEQLTVTSNARILKEDLFTPKSIWLTFPLWIQEIVTTAHLPPRIREGYELEYDTWEKFNNAWLMASAKLANWLLPDVLGTNAIKHEAEARLKGERVGAYHQMVIESLLGTERLVN